MTIQNWVLPAGSYTWLGYDAAGMVCAKAWKVGDHYRLSMSEPFFEEKIVGDFNTAANAKAFAERNHA